MQWFSHSLKGCLEGKGYGLMAEDIYSFWVLAPAPCGGVLHKDHLEGIWRSLDECFHLLTRCFTYFRALPANPWLSSSHHTTLPACVQNVPGQCDPFVLINTVPGPGLHGSPKEISPDLLLAILHCWFFLWRMPPDSLCRARTGSQALGKPVIGHWASQSSVLLPSPTSPFTFDIADLAFN